MIHQSPIQYYLKSKFKKKKKDFKTIETGKLLGIISKNVNYKLMKIWISLPHMKGCFKKLGIFILPIFPDSYLYTAFNITKNSS